jgi:hypothetical protein
MQVEISKPSNTVCLLPEPHAKIVIKFKIDRGFEKFSYLYRLLALGGYYISLKLT